MWSARLNEAQAGVKIAGRNINHLRNADDITLMAESEELKSLLMRVKEESEKPGLKLNIPKMKIMASSLITSWQIDREKMETVADFYFLGLQSHCRWWLQPWNYKMLAPWKKSRNKPDRVLKIRHIALPTKVCLVKATVFPVTMYDCGSWTIRKAEYWRNDTFLNYGAREDSWESLGLQGDHTSQS